MSEEGYLESSELEEINHLVHEGRAAEKGLRWNRALGLYESPRGWLVRFCYDGTWYEVCPVEDYRSRDWNRA